MRERECTCRRKRTWGKPKEMETEALKAGETFRERE